MKIILIAFGAALVGAGLMYVIFVEKKGYSLGEEWGTGPFSNSVIHIGEATPEGRVFQTQSFTTKPVAFPQK